MKRTWIKFNTTMLLVLFIGLFYITGCDNTPKEPANATAQETATETASTSDSSETTSIFPEGVAYVMEDGTSVFIDDLLLPVLLYNDICTTGKSDNFYSVYPQPVIDFILLTNATEDIHSYASKLYDLYHEVYGSSFSMKNEFLSCQPLTQSQLEDFSAFYFENIGFELVPDYGFLVESSYIITYTDENGEEQSDSETDYYIAYSLKGQMYLDYYYVDILDL